MDPFNIANFGMILAGRQSQCGGRRMRAIVTRAIHALVILSIVLPSSVVAATHAPAEKNLPERLGFTKSSGIDTSTGAAYVPPTFQRPEPRRVHREEVDRSSQEFRAGQASDHFPGGLPVSGLGSQMLLGPTPTPTPDPHNPGLPPRLPPLGQSVDQPEMLAQSFGVAPLSEGQDAGPSDLLISGDPSDETYPVAAYNSMQEEYLIVWTDDADLANLHAYLMNHEGGAINPEILIAAGGVGAPKRPELAYNPAEDTYMLLWSEPTGDYVSYYGLVQELHNLYALPLSRDGSPVNPTPTLITDQLTFFDVRMAYDLVYNANSNQYLVAWEMPPGLVRGSIYQPHTLYVQEIDATATLQGSPVVVFTGMVSSVRAEYSTASDEYIVTWDLANYGSLGYELYAQRLAPRSLAPSGGVIVINGLAAGWQSNAMIAYAQSSDAYLVTFEDTRPVTPGPYVPDIYAQLIQAGTGAKVGDNFPLLEAEDPVGQGDVGYVPGVSEFVAVGLPSTNHITIRMLDPGGEIVSEGMLFTELFGIQPRIAPRLMPDSELYRMLITWNTEGDIYGKVPVKDIVSEAATLVSINECHAEHGSQNYEGGPINTRTPGVRFHGHGSLYGTSRLRMDP